MQIQQNLLTPNPYSRPQKKIGKITAAAIHYVGNPNTSAINNRNYFEGLKDKKSVYASSHYIIGLQGEIIQCIPEDEYSYATSAANGYTISIENCHPDTTGKFNDKTYNSLVELCADICKRYNLDPLNGGLCRHYDVTGKICPKYYVENHSAWEQFKREVNNFMNGNLNNGGQAVADFKIGDKFNIKSTATTYFTGQNIASFAKSMTHTVEQTGTGKILSKEISSWFRVEDCINLTTPIPSPTPNPPPVDNTDYKKLYNDAVTQITNLNNTIKDLQTQNASLNVENTVLKTNNSNLQLQITALQNEKNTLNGRISNLNSLIAEYNNKTIVLEQEKANLIAVKDTYRNELDIVRAEVGSLNSEIDRYKELLKENTLISATDLSIGELFGVLLEKIAKLFKKEV